MHAANSGATQAQVPSIGFQAKLLEKEKVTDPIFTHKESFHFLFVRRFLMSIKSEALVFYPGGFGTLNELFEYSMLMQTKILDEVPLICVEKSYWRGILQWLKERPAREGMFIENSDEGIIKYADSVEEIHELIGLNRKKM